MNASIFRAPRRCFTTFNHPSTRQGLCWLTGLPKPYPYLKKFSTTTSSSNDSGGTVLNAARTLPYPTFLIFKVIADIPAYPEFLPYITSAKVLSQSPRPDSYHKQVWPALATLSVGFQDKISETFTSRVFCVPPVPHKGRAGVGFVEALSGADASSPTYTADEDVSHYDKSHLQIPEQHQQNREMNRGPLAFLKTRWTVSGYPHKPAPGNAEETHAANLEPNSKSQEMTSVHLRVEYRFNNPIYSLLGQAASEKVAEKMIEAFEARIKHVLGR